jgi:3-oxoacyl-[acyl-carrier-protein] synthase II
MAEGWDGIAPLRRFDPGAGPALAAVIPDRNAPEHGSLPLCLEMSIAAAREAWQRAQLDGTPPERIALVYGTSLGTEGVQVHEITAAVGDALAIAGPRLTVSTACASTTNAIGMALDLLALDAVDVVLAGGADVLTPLIFAGFTALGVLSHDKCAPFSEPPGTTLGEGAGFLVLGRDRPGSLSIAGYGLSTDGYHDTSPDPTGAGVARSMRGALAHAGIDAAQIDYVNVHGTGTRANDPAEWRALQAVLGERAASVPVSASKSFLGHAQGAAGVLETIATLVAMEQGALPPTQRVTVRRPNTPPDVVASETMRRGHCDVALKLSAGFGGANASIVIARGRSAPDVARRPVYIAAYGTALAGAELPPSIDPRGLDPSTRYLTAAVATALDRAALRMRGDARDRTGLVVGLRESSYACDVALAKTIAQHGYRGLSANLFARQVLNAAPGTCARLLDVRGLHSVISAGSAGGLAAAVYAAELVAGRRDVDAVLAAAVDERIDAAACSVLTATPTDVVVTSWFIAGPTEAAAERALAAAGVDTPDTMIAESLDGVVASALAVSRGADLIRNAEARSVLVTAGAVGCAQLAMVLTRRSL